MSDSKHQYDVAVVGGGPLGVAYAVWVKQARPATRVVLLERNERPTFKIGESTASAAVACLRSLGLPVPVLRRLFANKVGMSWWWTDDASDSLKLHLDGIEIAETFQVERRVLELALLRLAEEKGVEVRRGAWVDAATSDFGGRVKRLRYRVRGEEEVIDARIVCDASGLASLLPRAFGHYRKRPDVFTTNAYFGYFRPVSAPPAGHWDIPATHHICFPEGWMWFITVASWEKASDDQLERVFDELLRVPLGDDASYPSRQELSSRCGAPWEPLTSIGVVVRDDEDVAKHLPLAERFSHYVNRYPAIARVMDRFDLVRDAYPRVGSFSAFMRMAHDCERFSGDGWLAIGDSAMFTDPLFAPGLGVGSALTAIAAHDTVAALESEDTSAEAFRRYETYMQQIFGALITENEMLYRGFKEASTYERVLMTKIGWGISSTLSAGQEATVYRYVDDLLDPRYREVTAAVVEVLREADAGQRSRPEATAAVRAVVDPFLASLRLSDGRIPSFGRFLTHYTDDLERVEHRRKDPGNFRSWRCSDCRTVVVETAPRCSVCGSAKPSVLRRGPLLVPASLAGEST